MDTDMTCFTKMNKLELRAFDRVNSWSVNGGV